MRTLTLKTPEVTSVHADLMEEAVEAGLTVGYIHPYLCRICQEEEYIIQLWQPDGKLWAEGSGEKASDVRWHIQNYVRRSND